MYKRQLLNVRRVREGDKIILATTAGKAIMFSEEQVRATGRDTSGVRGIGMKDGVSVLGMEVTNGNGDLFVITERGYGKRTPVADYPEPVSYTHLDVYKRQAWMSV